MALPWRTQVEDRSIRKSIDPELLKQLEAAERESATEAKPVQAVFVLSAVKDSPEAVTPETTKAAVARIVDAARKASGEDVMRMNVFGNLGSFVVQASPRFVRHLIDDPQVSSARANRSSTSGQTKKR